MKGKLGIHGPTAWKSTARQNLASLMCWGDTATQAGTAKAPQRMPSLNKSKWLEKYCPAEPGQPWAPRRSCCTGWYGHAPKSRSWPWDLLPRMYQSVADEDPRVKQLWGRAMSVSAVSRLCQLGSVSPDGHGCLS